MIDLNTASADVLDGIDMLCGHGFEIVRCREEQGRFTSFASTMKYHLGPVRPMTLGAQH